MSDMVVSNGVPEVTVEAKDQSRSEFWAGLNADIAAANTVPEVQVQPEQPVVQPLPAPVTAQEPKPVVAASPEAVKPPVEVPDKFKNANGDVDLGKMNKSYLELERAFKREQNKNQVQQPGTIPQSGAPQPANTPLTPFEAQVAQDLIDIAAANGQPMSQAYAIAQAKVQVKLMDAKHQADVNATFGRVSQLEQTLHEQERHRELEGLARSQPWIVSPEGQKELEKVMGDNPHFWNAPEPYKAGVVHLLGLKAMQGKPVGMVNTPIPSGGQQQVAPLPVTPAQQAQTEVRLDSNEAVMAHLKTLTPQQEDEFWKRAGYKPIGVPRQNVGI